MNNIPKRRIPPPPPTRLRALVVEDDLEIGRFTARILDQAGYQVLTASDGQEALALLDTRDVDVLVTDLAMPRLDGLELISELRQSNRLLPVVATSGEDYTTYLKIAICLGASVMLLKPYTPQQLTEAVQEALDGR